MKKEIFLLKGIPPRKTFHLDMSGEERTAMHLHILYWQQLAREGISIVFGPVFDEQGLWGFALIEVGDKESALSIINNDPIVKAEIGFLIQIHPVPYVITRDSYPSTENLPGDF